MEFLFMVDFSIIYIKPKQKLCKFVGNIQLSEAISTAWENFPYHDLLPGYYYGSDYHKNVAPEMQLFIAGFGRIILLGIGVYRASRSEQYTQQQK